VAFEADLDKSAPAPFTLLGQKIVIWWDARGGEEAGAPAGDDGNSSSGSSSSGNSPRGRWRAFADACPHKLALLSEGRIARGGDLECPYHGWRWTGDGACAAIPQGADPSAPRARATAFPCASGQGIVFVRPTPLPPPPPTAAPRNNGDGRSGAASGGGGDDDTSPDVNKSEDDRPPLARRTPLPPPQALPLVPELEDADGGRAWLGETRTVVSDTWRDLPLDYATVMSNLADSSHVPFTHHRSISDRNVPNTYDVSLDGPVSAGGFSGVWRTGPRNGALGPQAGAFVAPNLLRQKIDGRARRGIEAMVIAYVTPSAPGRCRLLNRNTVAFVGKGGASGGGDDDGGDGGGARASHTRRRRRPLPAVLAGLLPRFASHLATQVALEDDQIFLHGAELEFWRRRAAREGGDGGAGAGAQPPPPPQPQYLPSPGADLFERSFRAWLSAHAGGGPFGAPGRDASAALPPRQTRTQLLDRWEQHTQGCASCLRALSRVRAARRWARAGAALLALLAAFSGAVAVALASSVGTGAAASAAATVAASPAPSPPASLAGWARGLGGRALALALAAGAALAGAGGGAEAAAARALAFAALALASAAAASALGRLEGAFLRGSWPPPRNLDKD